VTRPSLREYAAVQRERYLAATRAEKGTLLNEVVTVTGLHRKAAIRLLRRAPRAPTARSRAGRPPVYGSAVAQALAVLWQATGGIGPQRLYREGNNVFIQINETDRMVLIISPPHAGRGTRPGGLRRGAPAVR